MNNDLLKAERELARGNPDEARVHAWNALATIRRDELPRLLEVAEQLDEGLLIREVDERGIAPEPFQPGPEERFDRRVLLIPLVAFGIISLLSLYSFLSEPGRAKLHEDAIGSLPPPGSPVLTEHDGVWLVGLGPSKRVSIDRLAEDVTLRYGISVGALPAITTVPNDAYDARDDGDPEDDELDGDVLFDVISRWYAARGSATLIAITDYTMSSDGLGTKRPFLLRNHPHYAVVSTADLGAGPFDRMHGHTRYERTRKLVARAIGFLYLQLPQSTDGHSLLRSEMSGTGDIDALDERL